MAEYTGPDCALCHIQACDVEPGAKHPPAFCPIPVETELLEEVKQVYLNNITLLKMAQESARTESAGYCRLTRIEEIMDFARRLEYNKLGIAHCIGLAHEAKLAEDIFKAGGFQVHSVCCKVGSIPKETIYLNDEEKINPGQYEPLCSPVGQALLLAKAGTQLNVVIGLCVGHDSIFFMYTKAPATVLVAKDRVLGNNPAACLYTSHSYYHRLTVKK